MFSCMKILLSTDGLHDKKWRHHSPNHVCKTSSLANMSKKCFHFTQNWADRLLKWNAQDYGGVKAVKLPIDHIWKPDIRLYNRQVNFWCPPTWAYVCVLGVSLKSDHGEREVPLSIRTKVIIID